MKEHIPYYLTMHPEKSKIDAGLACGMLHTIIKGIKIDDFILCPDGNGNYYTGKVISDYFFAKDTLAFAETIIFCFARSFRSL